MESTLSTFKRPPSKESGENNALMRRMHQEKKEKKKRWTPSEDLKLTELVAVSGPRNWDHIGEKMQVKTGKSCRLRWLNQLDPRINKKAFNNEEDAMLLAAQRELGNKWSKIVKFFPRRTDIAVKNRWRQLMNKKLTKQAKEEATNLAKDKEAMEYSAHHHQFSTFPSESFALLTQHDSISQPSSSSSLPSEAKDLTEARYVKSKVPHKFIDFLGVGDS